MKQDTGRERQNNEEMWHTEKKSNRAVYDRQKQPSTKPTSDHTHHTAIKRINANFKTAQNPNTNHYPTNKNEPNKERTI